MKLRCRFDKLGRVRWTSQRDAARMWERALRRAGLPMAFTAGFNPRPQLSFGLALPTGAESTAEYVDVALTEEVAPDRAMARLAGLFPEGVTVTAVGACDRGAPSLQEEVTLSAWRFLAPGLGPDALEAAVETTLARPEPAGDTRERKGRLDTWDLRPSIRQLRVEGTPDGVDTGPHPKGEGPHAEGAWLLAELWAKPRGVRPAELAAALGVELGLTRRTQQWIERDGARREPLAVDAPRAPDALERAS